MAIIYRQFDCSIAWFERDGVYGNKTGYWDGGGEPGLSLLSKETVFRANIKHILQQQNSLHLALADVSPEKPAWRLTTFVAARSPIVRVRALEAMTRLRSASLPALYYMLTSPRYYESRDEIVTAVADAGKSKALPYSLKYVQIEMVLAKRNC